MKTTFPLLLLASLPLFACSSETDDAASSAAALTPPMPPTLVFGVEMPVVEALHRQGPGGATLSYVSFAVPRSDISPSLPADDANRGIYDAAANRSEITFPNAGGCDAHLNLEPRPGRLDVTVFGSDGPGESACADLTRNVAERGFTTTLNGVTWANGAWSPFVRFDVRPAIAAPLSFNVQLPADVPILHETISPSGGKLSLIRVRVPQNAVSPRLPPGDAPDLALASTLRLTIDAPALGGCQAKAGFDVVDGSLSFYVYGYDEPSESRCDSLVKRIAEDGFTATIRNVKWLDGTRRPEVVFAVR